MTTEPTMADPIRQPKTDLSHGPNGLHYATCRHCPWTYGPSVKSYVQERAMTHRMNHRAGRVEVTL
jgi:hypothetical protein